MKQLNYILAAAVMMSLASCADDSNNINDSADPANTGTEQVKPPVMNSGNETERARAEEAVGKDSTNRQTHVGKDEEGAVPVKTDSTP